MKRRKEEKRTGVRRWGQEKGELNERGGNPEGALCASNRKCADLAEVI